ncbi:MlaA family lipoprotein [Frigidibacter sp. ROC022]|uniref:MlaA family lipoprotein n=1 Tax=Frigidibacter sp. ROC022 TaxID=2971796 RepID=UPI00215A0F60|nr:VacJ family lipoprotein [Frigidibacter sp. ROC022]MCR8724868.1 VacJ family lipoprotein [Frigidibacter sp. ROC022]
MALALTLAVSGCGPAAIPDGIQDPYEAQNRRVHAENTSLDQVLIKPLSGGYGGSTPRPLRQGISHFADNVDTPRMVVNAILQGRGEDAIHNTFRFILNSTIGLAGLFDPATSIGLERRSTDFGETLHVWGVKEGNYVELPVLGPSTERDSVGKVVDSFLNPLGYVLPSPEKYVTTVSGGLSKIGDRYTYGSTVDSILYDSADSYAQARILYLQNRRHDLLRFGTEGASGKECRDDPDACEPDYYDPYEDQ